MGLCSIPPRHREKIIVFFWVYSISTLGGGKKQVGEMDIESNVHARFASYL